MESRQAPALPSELRSATLDLFVPAGLVASGAACETESAEYGACRLQLSGRHVAFRVAKTTPTKVGLFVTVWKRSSTGGEIAPIDSEDGVDYVLVHVDQEMQQGLFVFHRNVLVENGVLANNGVGGKRAFRVYPPWVLPLAKQAIRTQRWQGSYFLPIAPDGTCDTPRLRTLFSIGASNESLE